ncbi:hypothetical protein L4C34_11830 [Vibrio profundum]|uniref:hypothetical protein n=1 Tax=Vibrio profundum TaxID=2910247 RepID=UPI003D0FEA40
MKQRNIHGLWSMHFEGRVLYSEVTGATNKEAAQTWFDEMKQTIISSPESDITPWVYLLDCSKWIGTSLDSWETNNTIADWLFEHNCLFHAVVMPGRLQEFAVKTQMHNTSIIQVFFDYDKAHQACLDKLAQAQQTK